VISLKIKKKFYKYVFLLTLFFLIAAVSIIGYEILKFKNFYNSSKTILKLDPQKEIEINKKGNYHIFSKNLKNINIENISGVSEDYKKNRKYIFENIKPVMTFFVSKNGSFLLKSNKIGKIVIVEELFTYLEKRYSKIFDILVYGLFFTVLILFYSLFKLIILKRE